ncbi:hypothetical protein B0H14DRAFT_2595873 [Mycena olivaceomarginata]|nr:hypothetical protein B0H14DRAFT_2595873 [Mycena olivaceomarginata]
MQISSHEPRMNIAFVVPWESDVVSTVPQADWYFSGCKGLSTEFEILAGADRRHRCGYACDQFSVNFDPSNEGKGKHSNSALSPCDDSEKYQPAYGNALAALVALRRQAGHEPAVSSSRYNGADSVGTLRNNLFSVRVMTGYVCGCSGHVEDGLGKIEAPAAHRSSTEAALRRSEAMLRWSEAALLGYKLTLFLVPRMDV